MEVRISICPWCVHAEMNDDPEDLCGLFCGIGKTNNDGQCESFWDYIDEKEGDDNLALKTNVVKTNWQVRARKIGSYKQKVYLVLAESKEKAKLQVQDGWEVLNVKRIGGDEDE